MDRWFIVIVEIAGVFGAILGLWWLFEQAHFRATMTDLQIRFSQQPETPKPRKARKPKAKEERT